MKYEGKYKRLIIQLEPEAYQWVSDAAHSHTVSMSEVVRQAVARSIRLSRDYPELFSVEPAAKKGAKR